MSLINFTYFKRSLSIAQRSQLEVRDNIADFIQVKEPELLVKILGKELYEEFMTGLSEEPVLPKWSYLKSLFVNEAVLLSPIANYVFYYILENEATANTGIGVVETKGENSYKASPVFKMVKAWNDMIDMICIIDKEIKSSPFEYDNYKFMHKGRVCPKHDFNDCGCGRGEHSEFEYKNTLGI